MDSALIVAGGWLAFAGSHTLLSSTGVRPWLVGKLGQQGFMGLYTVIALGTFLPMANFYGSHKHEGPLVWEDGPRSITYTLMALAVYFLLAGVLKPSGGTVQGITKVTRHPAFIGFILFGLAHLVVNGYLTDIAFWGGFVLYTPFGAWHQDKRIDPEILAQTSFIPGLAILQGRQAFSWSDLGWIPLLATFFGVILLIQGHPYFAGVSLINRP